MSSDVSVKTTLKIIERLEEKVKKEKYVGVNELNTLLKNEILDMLSENNIEMFQIFKLLHLMNHTS